MLYVGRLPSMRGSKPAGKLSQVSKRDFRWLQEGFYTKADCCTDGRRTDVSTMYEAILLDFSASRGVRERIASCN